MRQRSASAAALGQVALLVGTQCFLEDHFAALAIGNLGSVHDTGAVVFADDDAIEQHEDRQREVSSSSDSGVENSTILPC
jgi:hypothetical protein